MDRRPNIIVILADDMSYWDISHFGQKEFSTPNIDSMARAGMVFTNAYAASPECAPSRAGLLTGRDMGHCTFRRLHTDVRPELHERPYLLPDDETIAHVLGSAGYTTCQIGKWHVGEPGTPGMPHLQGFEHSLCFDHDNNAKAKRAQYIYPTRLWRNGVVEQVPENKGFDIDHPDNRFDDDGRFLPGGMPDPVNMKFCEDIYLDEAIQFLRAPHKRPFFMYYASSLTHAEWPKELRELKDKQAPWTDDQKRWAGQATHMDRSVGAILDELKAQALDQNTLVIFTSDNGYAAWGYAKEAKRGRWEDDPVLKNKGPWDRGKFIAANGGVIVPFIAWGPGVVKKGETNRAVSFYDLKPTFADIGGATLATTDGVSFVPLLAGQESSYPQRDFLYWEQGSLGPNVQSALLDERFFALRMEPAEPIHIFEIFDDAGCQQDLASERQELVKRAERLFISRHEESPWYVNLTASLREQQSVTRVGPNNSMQSVCFEAREND
jgi:arylsulfatase A-like enzyme